MSTFGDAAAAPPELNHTLMIAGDLGASLVQAAAGYESVADMLIAELTAMGLNTSTTAAVGWLGPGGEMMQMTAAEFIAVCAAASAWIRVGQVHAAEVAAAHTAAVEMMVPAPVCTTNRVTQAGLVATNWFGQNSPAIAGLDAQYAHFWLTNAIARTHYGGVVSTALPQILQPPPLPPTASDPAAALAAVGGDAAQGTQSAFQSGAQTMMRAADAPVGSGGSAEQLMGSLGGQVGGLFGQVGSALGQVSSAGQSLPSMLGQGPSMMSGLLGPLSSSMTGMNLAEAGGALSPGVTGAAVPASVGAVGGGGGGLAGAASLPTTFVRPANSFSTPATPTLPGGWQGGPEPGAQARPGAGGGLYGAPPPMLGGDGGGAQSAGKPPARALQVTARAAGDRGERQRS